MNEIYYRQCELNSLNGDSAIRWLPEMLAVKGQVFTVKKTGEVWVVEDVFDERISHSYLVEHERDHLSQRRASDI